jgi:putative transposase
MTKHSPFRYFKTSQEVIRLAVMLYVRFPLSLRNVEDLLHERGIDVSHETIRFWWNRFGPMFASGIRKKCVQQLRAYSNWQWHLDEVFVKINGEMHYLWRAVDHEGEVLESYVTKRRDRKAALKFLRKSMKRFGSPNVIVTDKLRSYGAAMKVIGNAKRQETGRWLNNRAENSHLPFRRRERAMLRFRRMRSLQKFVAVHASVLNHFNQERQLYSRYNFKLNRTAALAEWRELGAGEASLTFQRLVRISLTGPMLWLRWLEVDDARLVWLRANGKPWKPICWELGISRATANRRWRYGLAVMVWRLNGRRVPRTRSMGLVVSKARGS